MSLRCLRDDGSPWIDDHRVAPIVTDVAGGREAADLGRRDEALPEVLPLRQFVDDFLEEFALTDPARRALVAVTMAPELTVLMDRTHLRQILWNLFANAQRHGSGQAGSIRLVAVLREDGRVAVDITDDGPGIAEALARTADALIAEPATLPRNVEQALVEQRMALDHAGVGIALVRQRKGDTTDVMLDYVGYSLNELRETYSAKVAAASLGEAESAAMIEALEAGLTGYTYLHETPYE